MSTVHVDRNTHTYTHSTHTFTEFSQACMVCTARLCSTFLVTTKLPSNTVVRISKPQYEKTLLCYYYIYRTTVEHNFPTNRYKTSPAASVCISSLLVRLSSYLCILIVLMSSILKLYWFTFWPGSRFLLSSLFIIFFISNSFQVQFSSCVLKMNVLNLA